MMHAGAAAVAAGFLIFLPNAGPADKWQTEGFQVLGPPEGVHAGRLNSRTPCPCHGQEASNCGLPSEDVSRSVPDVAMRTCDMRIVCHRLHGFCSWRFRSYHLPVVDYEVELPKYQLANNAHVRIKSVVCNGAVGHILCAVNRQYLGLR
jgi:hypothetical protein